MVDYQVVYRSVPYLFPDFSEKFFREFSFHGVDKGNLLVDDQIRVVGNPEWKRPQPFEKGLFMVIHSDISDPVRYFHSSMYFIKQFLFQDLLR